ncbi:hypothetical protein ECFRIK1985_1803, partial [Escherichia coli FRIK1985]
MLRVVVLRVLF